MAILAPSVSSKLSVHRPRGLAATRLVRRAGSEEPQAPAPAPTPAPAPVSGTVASDVVRPAAPAATPISSQPQASFGEVMAFSGAAPEVVNGRLAMLGFVAALGAELASEQSVLKQVALEPTGTLLAFILVISGSLVTIMQRKEGKLSLGPFTANAELLNGRAAMIGFAAMLAIELSKGNALF